MEVEEVEGSAEEEAMVRFRIKFFLLMINELTVIQYNCDVQVLIGKVLTDCM